MIKPSLIIELLEDTAAVLSFKGQNEVAIWPLVRHDVITHILSQNNKLDSAYTKRKVKIGRAHV